MAFPVAHLSPDDIAKPPPAMALEVEHLARAQHVVVDLGQIPDVILGRDVEVGLALHPEEPATVNAVIGFQRARGGVEEIGGAIGLALQQMRAVVGDGGKARLVRAVAKQGLDEPVAVIVALGRAREGAGYEPAGKRLVAGIAEDAPRDQHPLRLADRRQQIVKPPFARVDVQELVGVEPDHPVAVADQPAGVRRQRRLALRRFLRPDRMVDVMHHARRVQRVEQLGGAVVAVVRHREDRVEADGAVIADPFQQERRLVLDRGEQDLARRHFSAPRQGKRSSSSASSRQSGRARHFGSISTRESLSPWTERRNIGW